MTDIFSPNIVDKLRNQLDQDTISQRSDLNILQNKQKFYKLLSELLNRAGDNKSRLQFVGYVVTGKILPLDLDIKDDVFNQIFELVGEMELPEYHTSSKDYYVIRNKLIKLINKMNHEMIID